MDDQIITRQIKEITNHGGYLQVWKLSYPVIITMIFQTFVGLFGTMMIGRINTAQLGAAGLGSMIAWAFLSFFNGIISTASTYVAQSYGAKESKDIGRIEWHFIYIALASYVIMIILGNLSGLIFSLIGSSSEVASYSSDYFRIQLYSGIGVFISFALIGFFRGVGDTKTPMYITIIVSVSNVILYYFLIFGKFGLPRLEVIGMALSNGISSILSCIIYLTIYLSKRNNQLYNTRSFYIPDFLYIKRVIRIGLPAGVQFFLDTASFSLFTSFIARMGDIPLATSNAVMTFLNCSFMPLLGVSVAATTLVGQYIGAKNIEHAKKSGYTCIKLGTLIGAFMSVIFIVFPSQLLSLISKDQNVIDLGTKLMILLCVTRITEGIGICSGGALRGAGDTKFPMYVGLAGSWIVFVPLSYIFGFICGFGPIGAWIGTIAYIVFYDACLLIRFFRGKWQTIAI